MAHTPWYMRITQERHVCEYMFFHENDPLCMVYHPYHFVGEVLLNPVFYGGEEWLGFPDLWSVQKSWWNSQAYLTPVANFGEVRRAQLAKCTLLTSVLGPLGSFQMLKRGWGAESNRKLLHLFIPSKTATLVHDFAVEDLPLGRTTTLVPAFAVQDLPLGRTLWWW